MDDKHVRTSRQSFSVSQSTFLAAGFASVIFNLVTLNQKFEALSQTLVVFKFEGQEVKQIFPCFGVSTLTTNLLESSLTLENVVEQVLAVGFFESFFHTLK
jgi:hypothetical protein